MEETGANRRTGAGSALRTVQSFIRAVHRGDTATAAALCDPEAEFVVERGQAVPVVTHGPHTFAELYAPRPGAAWWLPWLRLRPAPGGVVAVWRAVAYGGGGEHRFLGVSVFHLAGGRITFAETTYVPVGSGRDARV